jgi:L-ascorbate metabolism protein UlaG (beta-lactamase superfamily)
MLDKATPAVAPRGAGRALARLGFTRIHEASPGERLSVAGLSLTATRADHTPMPRRNAPPVGCLGYVLEGSRKVYFAGDTDLFDEMRDLSEGLDVALLPVWGWGPRLGPGHLNPHTAAQATQLLNPRMAIPIHWGTLHPLGMGWLNPAYLRHPPVTCRHHAAQLAPKTQVRILQAGESTEV